MLLLILIGVGLLEYAGRTPWALHIGGRSTPDEQWDGFGQVQTNRGGRYVLDVHLQGGMLGTQPVYRSAGVHGQSDNLHGTAELCTESALTHTFSLTGVVDGWWTTDGTPTTIHLTGGTPAQLPSGWVVTLRGSWRGPALALTSPDNSFTEVFTARGEIRRVTSTADAGTARVTLQHGSRDQFAAACRQLQGR